MGRVDSSGRSSERPGTLRRLARPPRAAAPVRHVHLGLGNFFRAHQAWYTSAAPDASGWGISAFSGRSHALADALSAQGGLYALLVRGPEGDRPELVGSISRAYSGADMLALRKCFIDPALALVTLTVTEAGYVRGANGRLDPDDPVLAGDMSVLRSGEMTGQPLATAPGRLVAGLAARRATGGGALAIVSCDNLPGNGAVTAAAVTDLAAAVDGGLATWIGDRVSFVDTVVDRITPATTDDDRVAVRRLTGFDDRAPVITEPFREWVLAGDFPAGRPDWEAAGARAVTDVAPYEERKLWLLNGGHSLLAYLGAARGHTTVADAIGDAALVRRLEEWWDLAGTRLALPAAELTAYRRDLTARFTNPRIRHLLSQIGTDGSQKLPVRVLPVIRRERAAGRLPVAGLRVLAGWLAYLARVEGVRDVARERLVRLTSGADPVRAVLGELDPALAADEVLVRCVGALATDPTGDLQEGAERD